MRVCVRASMHTYVRACVCVYVSVSVLVCRSSTRLSGEVCYVYSQMVHLHIYRYPITYVDGSLFVGGTD